MDTPGATGAREGATRLVAPTSATGAAHGAGGNTMKRRLLNCPRQSTGFSRKCAACLQAAAVTEVAPG